MKKTVFERLTEAYQSEGIHVAAGLNPTLSQDFFAAPFSWMVRDGVSVTDGVGISPQELYFIENLAMAKKSEKIFVIGNAFGWSTLALAMANPGSKVLAIDSGADQNTIEGIAVTNKIARRAGLQVTTVEATSPRDVSRVVREHLGSVDLAFIDGFHSEEQIVLDYRAVAPVLSEDGVILFHDVMFCDLVERFKDITEWHRGWGNVLPATTTGMGLLTRCSTSSLRSLVRAWGGSEEAWSVVRAEASRTANRTGSQQRQDALEYIRSIQEGRG